MKLLSFITFLFTLIFTGCAIGPSLDRVRFDPTEGRNPYYSKSELFEDIEFMSRTFEEVHPDLYYYAPEKEILRMREALKKTIPDSMKRVDFFKTISSLVAELGDGHTYTNFPIELNKYQKSEKFMFPISIRNNENKIFIKSLEIEIGELDIGDQIININGFNTDSLFQQFKLRESGVEIFKKVKAEKKFSSWLWIFGIQGPFLIDAVKEQSNDTISVQIKETDRKTLEINNNNNSAKKSNYSFRKLEQNIGYLEFRSMINEEEKPFKAFLKETFQSIKKDTIDGLIIDMRKNGGGDSRMGSKLLDYISDKPYNYDGRIEAKSSAQMRRYFKVLYLSKWFQWFPIQFIHPIGWKLWYTQKDQIVIIKNDKYIYPKSNTLRYKGPVYFLIGDYTFSSAMLFIDIVKANKLFPLIGTETGGTPNGFGWVYFFNLPNTQLPIGVSMAMFVGANGDETWPGGVLPDIEVKQSAEDLKNEKDTVLEFTKELIYTNENQ